MVFQVGPKYIYRYAQLLDHWRNYLIASTNLAQQQGSEHVRNYRFDRDIHSLQGYSAVNKNPRDANGSEKI